MKLSDYVIDFLVSRGINHIFEVCGGSLAHLLDSLYGREDITAVSMHHEMAAAIAAEGYSRVCEEGMGVAMATSGPGATNLITGIGSCFFDSIPCLFVTGQVNTYEFKFDKPTRQIGFQETDIVNIVKPITKKAELIMDETRIRFCLEDAIDTAKRGRPGPVLLDLPMNIQRAEIEPSSLSSYDDDHNDPLDNVNMIDENVMDQVVELIKSSCRPIILVGGGVRSSKGQDELLRLSHNARIPVVTSLMGLDAFPHDDALFVGMIGTYGNRYANLAIANSDLVIALGTRLDTRQTGTRPETFARGAKIVHVDIDPVELNNKIEVEYAINSDIRIFLSQLNEQDPRCNRACINTWIDTIKSFKESYPSFCASTGNAITPNYFMHLLSEHLPENAIICVDVGQNQMWAAQSLEIKGTQRFLTEGGMASMGCALPMAIGASFAKPGKPIIVITGDGGFQLNIQELETVYHHSLPIKIILLNNACYGMVRQFQEQYLCGRCQSTVIGYSSPDFQKVVSAYKISSMKITQNDEITDALEILFSDLNPGFLEIEIGGDSKVVPKLSVNRPAEDQEPLLSRQELALNMFIDILPEPETYED
jgi:acetolactate synthase-1/2/3 large subunit